MTALTFPLLAAILVGFSAAALLAAWLIPRPARLRRQALSRLLDAADALEDRLRDARDTLEQAAGTDPDGVRAALQEMLRQRLWLQQHGDTASLSQLNDIRRSIDAARKRLDEQLTLVERARAGSEQPG